VVFIIIAVLCIAVVYQKIKLILLKQKLEETVNRKREINSEYLYYYKLSERLYDTYRTYDIFPSKSVREISKQKGW